MAGLPPGKYTVTVNVTGFLPTTAPKVLLATGENFRLQITAVPLPKSSTTVEVTASELQVATAQVHLEEKQRVLGFVPNFSTSFVWNAAPLTPKLKYSLVWHSVRDPFTFLFSGGVAGLEQAENVYKGYGQGLQGYGKRFGASYGDAVIARTLGDGVYAQAFHEDPRYFYRGSGSFGGRLWYALRSALVSRRDNGTWGPDYAGLLGDFSAAGIANFYHSPVDRSAGITLRDGAVIVAGDAVENVLREFLSRDLTSHLPPGANGRSSH